MNINWKDYIISSVDILHGKPRIKNTRIPVGLVLGYLSARYTFEEIIQEFPDLKEEHISACLDFARDLAEYEVAAV